MPNVRPYIVNDPAHAHQVALAGSNGITGFMPPNLVMPRADQDNPLRPHTNVPTIPGSMKRGASGNTDGEPEYKRRRTQSEPERAPELLTAAQRLQYRASMRDELPLIRLAVIARDDDAVDMLLASDSLQESERIMGDLALREAAAGGNLYAMERLLQAGAHPYRKCGKLPDALCFALDHDQLEAAQLLLSYPVPEEEIASLVPGFGMAVRKKQIEICRILIEKNPALLTTNPSPFGQTLLHGAASVNNLQLLKMLCERGAEVDAKCNKGKTPLMLAAARGHEDAARILIRKGAQINAQCSLGRTALWHAAGSGHLSLIRLLLAERASRSFSDSIDDKRTARNIRNDAFREAVRQGRTSAVWAMLQYANYYFEILLGGTNQVGIVTDLVAHARRIPPNLLPTDIMAFGEHGIPVSKGLNCILDDVLTSPGDFALCSPLAERLAEINKELPLFIRLLSYETFGSRPPAQIRAIVAGVLNDQEDWVNGWPDNWSPYQGLCDSEELSSRLAALLHRQASVLGEIGRQADQTLLVPALKNLPLQFFTQLFQADAKPAMIRMLCDNGLFHPHASRVAQAWWQTREQHHAGIAPSSVASTEAAEAFSQTAPGREFMRDLVAALREQLSSPQGWFTRTPQELSQRPVSVQALYAQLMWRHLDMLQQLTNGLEHEFAS